MVPFKGLGGHVFGPSGCWPAMSTYQARIAIPFGRICHLAIYEFVPAGRCLFLRLLAWWLCFFLKPPRVFFAMFFVLARRLRTSSWNEERTPGVFSLSACDKTPPARISSQPLSWRGVVYFRIVVLHAVFCLLTCCRWSESSDDPASIYDIHIPGVQYSASTCGSRSAFQGAPGIVVTFRRLLLRVFSCRRWRRNE